MYNEKLYWEEERKKVLEMHNVEDTKAEPFNTLIPAQLELCDNMHSMVIEKIIRKEKNED